MRQAPVQKLPKFPRKVPGFQACRKFPTKSGWETKDREAKVGDEAQDKVAHKLGDKGRTQNGTQVEHKILKQQENCRDLPPIFQGRRRPSRIPENPLFFPTSFTAASHLNSDLCAHACPNLQCSLHINSNLYISQDSSCFPLVCLFVGEFVFYLSPLFSPLPPPPFFFPLVTNLDAHEVSWVPDLISSISAPVSYYWFPNYPGLPLVSFLFPTSGSFACLPSCVALSLYEAWAPAHTSELAPHLGPVLKLLLF